MNDTIIRPGGTADLAGHSVARIGYGAMALERFTADPEAGVRLLRRAVELGIDHIDTADFYGDSISNDLIRRAIRPVDDVVVVTKVGALKNPGGPIPLRPGQRPEQLRQAVEDNLRTLGRERLDVVNLRRLDVGPGIVAEGEQVVDLDDQLAALIALRDAGTVGAIGLSAVDEPVLRRALPAGIVCVQNAYGVVDRRFEPLLRLCADQGIAWVPFFPLGSGFPGIPKATEQPEVIAAAERLGATPAQIGLAWLLAHSPVALIIAGTSSAAHLAENVAVGGIDLDPATTAELDAIWESRFASAGDPAPRWTD
ncbi:aldo/keto reductase [Leifsonia sp. ZF2019]|uniref:aldo/keto reductase n=1 Tax=Leifsonia sp. ZF2019 TaxID=2781978 RepID=UPI001CBB6F58|nr:aldo/keto reductase [Leifsonia sp. ZF2019]UAJ80609.1 aldo/keto reductase [Leifsonia sp. ZF2019]